MELKKSPKADLKGKRSYLFMLGTIVALFATIAIFSWSKTEKKIDQLAFTTVSSGAEEVIITLPQDQRQAAPLNAKAFVPSEIIRIVPNTATITTPVEFPSVDDIPTYDPSKYTPGGTGVEELTDEDPILFAEEMATFNGEDGQIAFSKWCQDNMTYPALALDNGVQGRVTISFVVEPNGKITNIKLERGASPDLDRAALAIVAKSPNKWKPAKNNGRAVRLKINIPIVFQLQQ